RHLAVSGLEHSVGPQTDRGALTTLPDGWDNYIRSPRRLDDAHERARQRAVRAGRLELPPLSRPGPKPGASASSATLASGHLRARGPVRRRGLDCGPRKCPSEVRMGKQVPIVDYLVID